MITKIEIEGFKSIKALSISLKPINILIGANGAGKSNFISLFSFIRNIYNRNLQNYVQRKGGMNSLLHFGKKNTSTINIVIYFKSASNHENKFILELEAGHERLFIKSTRTAFKSYKGWTEREYENNIDESGFQDINWGQAYWVNDRLNEFGVYHFHDTSDNSPMKTMSDIDDNYQLKRDGSNIAAFLYYLKKEEPKHFKRIELTVKSIASFFGHFDLKPNLLNKGKIQLEWREEGYLDTYFNAYHLSDGTLRFICLATLLMQPYPPSTIIIDEPELGLHPVAINKLAAIIRKASTKTQIVLSTQSINLMDNFEPEDVIVTDRKDHTSIFNRLNKSDLAVWLDEEYTIGDLWEQNKLGAQPYNKQ